MRLHNTARFKEMWNSHGTMSRSKVGIWGPDLEMGFHKKNVVRVCLGHYANVGFGNPGKQKDNGTCQRIDYRTRCQQTHATLPL